MYFDKKEFIENLSWSFNFTKAESLGHLLIMCSLYAVFPITIVVTLLCSVKLRKGVM